MAQPPPEGAQLPPEALADVPVVAKDENCCSVFFDPQWGQTGNCWFLPKTNFSKVFLHF